MAKYSGEERVSNRRGSRTPHFAKIECFLESADEETLRNIIRAEAIKDAAFRDRLVARIALDGTENPDFKEVRRSLKKLLHHRGAIHYQEAYEFSNKLDEAHDILQDLLNKGHSSQTMELLQELIPVIEEAYACSDDSAGHMGGSIEQLAELFKKACESAKPDPRCFAEWLFAYDIGSNWGEFGNTLGDFDAHLGEEGVGVYQELARKEWEKLPTLKPESRYGEHDYKLFSRLHMLKRIMVRVAEAAGDDELQLAIAKKDLSHPGGYLHVAEILERLGRLDEAVQFIEQGKRELPTQFSKSVFSPFLSDAYLRQGKKEAALALYWRAYSDFPCLNNYKDLHTVAKKAGEWHIWQGKALEHIRKVIAEIAKQPKGDKSIRNRHHDSVESINSRLVEIFCWEKRYDEAWQEANENGCDEREWLALASEREKRSPADCVPIYRGYCTRLLNMPADNRTYAETGAALQKLETVMRAVGETDKFLVIMEDIRKTFKVRKNLIKELDKRKLP